MAKFFPDERGRLYLTLDPYQAVAFLKAAKWRKAQDRGRKVDQLLWEDRWLTLATTDFKDDVRVSRDSGLKEQALERISRDPFCLYGARITRDAFYLIDHYSDG